MSYTNIGKMSKLSKRFIIYLEKQVEDLNLN